jgi:hypothetical protein
MTRSSVYKWTNCDSNRPACSRGFPGHSTSTGSTVAQLSRVAPRRQRRSQVAGYRLQVAPSMPSAQPLVGLFFSVCNLALNAAAPTEIGSFVA